jgi:Fe-S-cluster containining protein
VSEQVLLSAPSFNYPADLAGQMRCSHCEKCCHDTEMQLCKADIARLERMGYEREDFVHRDADGIPRLRNTGGFCFFYDHERRRCREYSRRPLGCVIYPVNMSTDGEVVVDELCPEASSIGREELDSKGRRLRRLLDTITLEVRMDDSRVE